MDATAAEELQQQAENQRDPTVAAADARGWVAWATRLALYGKAQLARLGLTLAFGFGLAVLALVVFAGIAEEVMDEETMALDTSVLMGLQTLRSPLADTLMQGLSLMGSEVVAVLMPVLLLALGFARRFGAAGALILVVGGAQMLNNVLKDVFERTRPAPVAGFIPAQQFSFPSGHAMVSAAFYLFLAYLGWRLLRGRSRYLLAATLLLLVLLIGVSRLYLQAHYFTDVVAGYVVGFLWTDAVILGGRFLRRRRAIADEPPTRAAPARPRAGGAITTPGG